MTNEQLGTAHQRLVAVLAAYPGVAIAVSGGIDSLTLATIAHRTQSDAPLMVHACSPAVPQAATARVRDLAAREGWQLREIEAGEFSDPDYRANPYNRCYFCKSNLYRAISSLTGARIASGANTDDLTDYRPGLKAAAEKHVVHPFIEAGINKATIRELARLYGLGEYADLPAQPCLASRVETDVPIRVQDMHFIDALEGMLHHTLGVQATIRVRVRLNGVFVELGEQPEAPVLEQVRRIAKTACGDDYHFMGVREYRQGSAFVDKASAP